jgi:hypothetical protein
MCVLHRCDNPPCVAIDHLFLGTQVDNRLDCCAKGRQASGDAHGARLHPERLSRGEAHGARMREVAARGDANGARLHPESQARGEAHGNAKLNEGNVRFVFQLRARGWTKTRLAAEFGVSRSQIGRILDREVWKHVRLEESQ